ncbi:MAG TPA: hypothetical protein VGI80_05330 [Pyrinomonadaceae bacterium]|jgi:mannose-6-phosphate isomerase-like protein (cupin superfamily)
MLKSIFLTTMILLAFGSAAHAQRKPSVASRPFVVTTNQQIGDIQRDLEKQAGNKSTDIVAAAGTQMRVAVFNDENRVDDNVELHDASDDVYYVLSGTATLMLGGTLDSPTEISPGEWRAKTATGGKKVMIKKGDLIVVPRGTPHQRTVTEKGFSMILVKIFAQEQPGN